MEKNSEKIESYTEINITGKKVGVFILIFVILLTAFIYKISTKSNYIDVVDITPTRPTPEINKEPESPTAYAQVNSLKVMSPSDELSSIEADLKSTDLDSLTHELKIIESELGY